MTTLQPLPKIETVAQNGNVPTSNSIVLFLISIFGFVASLNKISIPYLKGHQFKKLTA